MKKSTSYIGLDVHKDTIAVAVADYDSSQPRFHGPIRNEREEVRRLFGRLSGPQRRWRHLGTCRYRTILHAEPLQPSWDEIHGIMERAVKCGWERRQAEPVTPPGERRRS